MYLDELAVMIKIRYLQWGPAPIVPTFTLSNDFIEFCFSLVCYVSNCGSRGVVCVCRCEEYFHERKLEEREARLKEAKEYWEREAVAMMGF